MVKFHRPSNLSILLHSISIITCQLIASVIFVDADDTKRRAAFISMCNVISIASLILARNDKQLVNNASADPSGLRVGFANPAPLELDMIPNPQNQYIHQGYSSVMIPELVTLPPTELPATVQQSNFRSCGASDYVTPK